MNKFSLRTALLSALMMCSAVTALADKVKVACVGNSVTFGYGLENRDRDAYPVRLQQMLGDQYEVGNFGKSGATLLRKGHRPYNEQQEYKAAVEFGAEIAVIHLGLNDTDPRNWPNHRDEFEADYQQLIDDLNAAAPGGHLKKLVVCCMTPIFHGHHRFKSGTRDWHGEIQEAIARVALRNGIEVLDINSPLHCRPDLFPDNLHPNADGARILAETIYGGVTGDWGGLRLADIYSDGMVLQHNEPVVRGRANAGETVEVQLYKGGEQPAQQGKKSKSAAKPLQTVKAQADINGRWEVRLGALVPGAAYRLHIAAPSRSLDLNDVLAGEVWLCSGQSNMAFRLNQCVTANEDIADANRSLIRLYDMKERWRTDNVEWPEESLAEINALKYYEPAHWTPCSSESAAQFSAIGYHFGRVLADSLKMPIGLICNAIGGSTTESWVDRTTIEREFPDVLYNWQNNDFIQDWARGRAAKNVAKSSNIALQRHPYLPCYLYEAGIQPLDAFPIKGVIWYQGESNAHNKEAHDRLFTLLVDSWRQNWNNLAMPVYFVQLSSLNRPSWPWFRDSQRILQNEIRNTGMVVTTDLGDSLDVHPRYKKEVGERLARLALNERYGYDQLTPCGPTPFAAKFSNGAVVVLFENGKGMRAGKSGPVASDSRRIQTLEVAGADGIFYPAEGEVLPEDGKSITRLRVVSDKVKNPVSVRYGWQPYTHANLVNGDNLPATTFRFDKK